MFWGRNVDDIPVWRLIPCGDGSHTPDWNAGRIVVGRVRVRPFRALGYPGLAGDSQPGWESLAGLERMAFASSGLADDSRFCAGLAT